MRFLAGLLIDKTGKRCYVTKRQNKRIYVGDLSNIISILEHQGCNELVILNIDSYLTDDLTNNLSRAFGTCLLPVSYGGGINDFRDASELISKGVERIVIGQNIFCNTYLIEKCIANFGSQAIAVSIDIKLEDDEPYVYNRRSNIYLKLSDVFSILDQFDISELIVTFSDYNELNSAIIPRSKVDELRNKFQNQLLIAGGIRRNIDIIDFEKIGVNGIIVSSHLYLVDSYNGICIDYKRKLR